MTSKLLFTLLIQLSVVGWTSGKSIVFVILSQANDFHSQRAEDLRKNITNQYKDFAQISSKIYLSHKDFSHIGSWTIFPLLLNISNLDFVEFDWLVFLEDNTAVNLQQLNQNLEKYDHNQEIWIGNELYDTDATIIHHFAFHKNPSFLKYPNIASGFALTTALLKSIGRVKDFANLPDFNIDNSYELALFIWNGGKGQTLISEPAFCIVNSPQCATYVNFDTSQNNPVLNEHILFSVKTCEKFHENRIPIVKNTWGKTARHIKYFSNVEEKSIPTICIGIPNTERGHCAKTMAILKYVDKEVQESGLKITWFVLVDDDTILSVSRLQQLLSRYNHSQDIAVGERYGYNMAYTPSRGYNYITGGGGMVFSMPLVKKLVNNCKCPTPDAPDDMIIGACTTTLNIPIIHSPAFHQARPVDYSPKYLQIQEPISFHKHWMIDPIKVYEEWFVEDTHDTYLNNVHNEL